VDRAAATGRGDVTARRVAGLANVWKEFKEFAFRGNLIDLAVAFVLGLALTAVIASIVNDIIMPIIGAIFSDKSFSEMYIDAGGAHITYGNLINNIIYFLIVALVLFFIVKAVNKIRRPAPGVPISKECSFCFTTIPEQATRCPNCTSQL
jgi:large conductance mechanosensitive channel